MKSPTASALLLAILILVPAVHGAETNQFLDLFGITVTTNGVSEAEKEFELGSAYCTGDGVETNMAKAAACFRKAAELGHGRAQFNLGLCCMNGTGVAQNDKEAARWFQKAAEQDIRESYYPLGICCYNLEQHTEAYTWALMAESAGDARLREMLAPMFSDEETAAARKRFGELMAAREKRQALGARKNKSDE